MCPISPNLMMNCLKQEPGANTAPSPKSDINYPTSCKSLIILNILQNYCTPYKHQQSKISSFNTRSPLILDILLADISVVY